jgi:hypothetical protein
MTSRNSAVNPADGGFVKNQIDSTTEQNKTIQPPANNNNQVAVKENKQPAAVKEVDDVKNNLAVNNQKKSGTGRNIERNKNVTQQSTVKENVVALKQETPVKQEGTQVEPEVNKVVVKPMYAGVVKNNYTKIQTDAFAAANEPGTALNKEEKPVYYYIDENSSEDDIKLANASINKKPVRGLIRKVKGLFEGNNDEDEQPQPEKKKGIRIAAFSIALK